VILIHFNDFFDSFDLTPIVRISSDGFGLRVAPVAFGLTVLPAVGVYAVTVVVTMFDAALFLGIFCDFFWDWAVVVREIDIKPALSPAIYSTTYAFV
jgi:hypothetical protein